MQDQTDFLPSAPSSGVQSEALKPLFKTSLGTPGLKLGVINFSLECHKERRRNVASFQRRFWSVKSLFWEGAPLNGSIKIPILELDPDARIRVEDVRLLLNHNSRPYLLSFLELRMAPQAVPTNPPTIQALVSVSRSYNKPPHHNNFD